MWEIELQQLKYRLTDWLTPDHISNIFLDLLLAITVLIVTYLIVKLNFFILGRLLKEKTMEGPEVDNSEAEQGIVPNSLIRSTRVLLQTLLLYGSYFVAAIIILEIFNVKVVSGDDLKSIGTKALKIIGVLVGAKLAINIGHLGVKQIFERHNLKDNVIESRRAHTLEALLRSVLTYIVFFVAGITIMGIFNVNTGAILASAGILGLAMGFGAQNLVKDVISGFFIIFEDQFGVGDFVEAGGATGTVEEVGLRSCKIRQWTGQLHVIPNGEITRVTNYHRGPMMALVTVGIAYEEDIDEALEVLRRECETAQGELTTILDSPQVQGVVELADSAVNIRIIAPSVPGEQWAVERELRRRFKYALDRAGIEIPYPRRVLYQRSENGQV